MVRHRLLPVLFALLPACASAPPNGVSLDEVADELARADVVFLGEEHDNAVGHEQQRQLLILLHERRPDLVLSMEMFERDVQGHLDAYLAGEIDEEQFLAESRPWDSYARYYRPLVEYAKAHDLPVIAANVPRTLANQVSSKGAESVVNEPHAARTFSYPKDGYWESFKAAMKEHMGVGAEGTMFRFYQAQCLKDDTMAESISDYLSVTREEGRSPLVVHVCGKFHSDDRFGTVARVAERMPELELAVVSMESVGNAERRGDGDFVLYVPTQPSIQKRAKPEPAAAPEKDAVAAAEEPAPAAEPDELGSVRPGLGFMPGYDDDVIGVLVDALRPGGPADQAGIRAGDIILKLGDDPVTGVADYVDVLARQKVGQKIEVQIDRAGKAQTVTVVVGESHR